MRYHDIKKADMLNGDSEQRSNRKCIKCRIYVVLAANGNAKIAASAATPNNVKLGLIGSNTNILCKKVGFFA